MNRGPARNVDVKSKDFFGSLKRLFKELKIYKIAIIISLLLASFGSILSIIAPDKLSNLTDEIAKGLIVKKDNIELITNTITNNLNNIKIENILYSTLSDNEKNELFITLSNTDNNNKTDIIKSINRLPNSILYNILPEFSVDNVVISPKDQLDYLNIMSSINSDVTAQEMLKKIDELPSNIQSVVKPSIDWNTIINIAIFLIALYIISALFNYIESLIMTIVSNRFAKKLRSNISKKINKLPLKYFDNNQVGDILSRVTNDVDTIAMTMNQSLATLVSSITLFLGSLIMMFVTNYIMAITAILSSIIGFTFMSITLSKSQKYFKMRQKELGKLNSHIEEIYSGLLVVKAYNGKKDSDKKFDELNKNVYEANRKSQFLSGLMPSSMMFIGNLGYVSVCIVGAILTSNNIITFGVIVAFMTYIRLFTNPLSQIAQGFTSLQATSAASERVFEFMDEEEMVETKPKYHLDKSKVKGNIEFNHVKFAYNEDKIIIKDFNAKVKSGQKVAIVGPTGAGKTTMVNLLKKFYNIVDGDIKIDDVSIKDLSYQNVHELFTMVLQDTWLFNGTIKENIIYNRENVSDEQVKKICEIVGLNHFIKTLPNTYNSKLEESDSISSGQKQLLTITRGMVDDAPFLILDEATSNVDTRTEELVQKAMDKLTMGKTSFIIAHRLSTIKNADLILVMKDGNIVEQGKHNELIKKNGFYAEIYNSQFQK